MRLSPSAWAVYLLTLGLALVVLVTSLMPEVYQRLTIEHWFSLGLLFLFYLFAEANLLPWRVPNSAINVSVSTGIDIALVLLFGPAVAVPFVALALIVSELIARQRPLIKASFNVAVVILYTAAACAVFSLLGSVGQSPLANWQQVIAWLLAAITHVLVNASLLALMISMATRVPLLPLWREMVSGGEMQHWLQPLLGGLIAIMQLHSPWALILVILPLLAIYVSNRRLYQVGQETRTVIETLVDTLDRRDPATFEHSVRVTDYTRRILEQLYPTAGPEVTRILAASRIHDLGKVAVSDATLYKNGPLDGPEWRQMRHHPVIGAQLLRPLSIYQEGLAIVRHHHERWDGTGYPDGLAGEQIPFGARVLAVADSFDAMTTDRPYRRALSIETALKEIEAGSGSQFDPTVVEAFLTVMRSRPAATSLRPLPGTPSGA